jgi:hypothetical protein
MLGIANGDYESIFEVEELVNGRLFRENMAEFTFAAFFG